MSAKIIPIRRVSGRHLVGRTDDQLMALAGDGAASAFDELVRRYQHLALHAASQYLNRPAHAPDVVRRAFARVYRSLHADRRLGRFRSLFFEILLDQCRLAGRRRRTTQRTFHHPIARRQTGRAAAIDVEAHDNTEAIRAGVTRLSHAHRAAIALRYGAGLTLDEVAEHLDLPVGSVKSRISGGLGFIADNDPARAANRRGASARMALVIDALAEPNPRLLRCDLVQS